MKLLTKFQYNSPVVLTFALVSFIVLVLGVLTNGWTTYTLFSTYRSSPFNLLTYVRLFGHVLGHSSLEHYTGNMLLILLLGPVLEEKYGSKNLLIMIMVTALITSIFHNMFFMIGLLGASGIVFMMIILASMASAKEGKIPLTLIVAILVYIGDEVVTGLFTRDNISQLTHIVGGICGGVFGKVFLKNKKEWKV